ncbi:dihydrofolate reductase [Porphyromonas pogonae]|uniref:dihydrofolate reductase n=1 Tax=Porphyromonas pogonae TaxID=867595 RepID=UPI002E7AA089|nr:dihydrofolate reductase [Porphyromonas pogonae]
MKISIIVAVAENNAIGINNKMPWHLSNDLKRFKSITSSHIIIMGKNTYYSLPNGALPNRENLVLSSSLDSLPDAQCFKNEEELKKYLLTRNDDEVFVIGGGKIYHSMLPQADKMYLTVVHKSYPEADTFFPEFDRNEWEVLEQQYIPADDKNDEASTYYELERKRN